MFTLRHHRTRIMMVLSHPEKHFKLARIIKAQPNFENGNGQKELFFLSAFDETQQHHWESLVAM